MLIEERYGLGKEKYLLRMTRGSPLGLKYLAAVLSEQRNIHSDILDERLHPFSREDLLKIVRDGGYDTVGFYLCSEPELEKKAVETIAYLRRESDIPIIAGGPPFETFPVLKAGCDMICHGEGESAILDMIDVLEGRRSAGEIDGISYLQEGREVRTGARSYIESLDDIPFPRRDKASVMKYFCLGNPNMRRPYISIVAARGCPMNCAFCNTHEMWGRKTRYRSPDNVIEEIEFTVNEFGARYLAFRDDIFGVKRKWLEEFCEKMIAKTFPIRWCCNQHPLLPAENHEEVISLMSRAGCDTLHYGIQSGDEEILERINRKPVELKLLKEKIATAKKYGMLTFLEFIVGLPGESESSMKKSLNYAFEAMPAYVTFYSLGILKGSQIEKDYTLANMPVTSLSDAQIDTWVRTSRRKYMLNIKTLLYLFRYVIAHNPLWLFQALRVIPQGLSMLGIGRKWKTF